MIRHIALLLLFSSCTFAATRYVDYEGGSDAADGLSFATRKKTITSASTGSSAGDVIRVMASPAPSSVGNAAWTNLSPTVTLASGRTANVYQDGAWTASTNVTATASATRKEGSTCSSLAIAAAFTTGLVAYYPLGGATDYSAYQKLSFSYRASLADADMSNFQIVLCSDAAGATPVDTLTFPVAASIANMWLPIVIDKGSALGASIQSVAIYATSDPGTTTLLVDNVIATNDLHHGALIGKNSAGELWWALRSIVGTTLILEQGPNSSAGTASRGYVGTTEAAVTTYMREPIKLATVTSATTNHFTIGTSGSSGSPITISGGWNRTDMSTQTDVSWFSGQNTTGEFMEAAGRTYNSFEKLNCAFADRYIAVTGTCTGLTFSECNAVALAGEAFNYLPSGLAYNTFTSCAGIQSGAPAWSIGDSGYFTFTSCRAHANLTGGVSLLLAHASTFDSCNFTNNTGYGLSVAQTTGALVSGCTLSSNSSRGLSLVTSTGNRIIDCTMASNASAIEFSGSAENEIVNLTTSGQSSNVLVLYGNPSGTNVFNNWTRAESNAFAGGVSPHDSRLVSVNEGGSSTTHAIYGYGGTIASDVSVRHTGSGISWKMSPTVSGRDATFPLLQRVAAIPVKANVAVTATCWLRRTDTGITGVFRMRGKQVAGVTLDISDDITASANTWEQQTLSFTPTADGVVEFEVICYGGTTHSVYWDGFAVSAASYINASAGDYGWYRTGAYIGSQGSGGASTGTSSVFGF